MSKGIMKREASDFEVKSRNSLISTITVYFDNYSTKKGHADRVFHSLPLELSKNSLLSTLWTNELRSWTALLLHLLIVIGANILIPLIRIVAKVSADAFSSPTDSFSALNSKPSPCSQCRRSIDPHGKWTSTKVLHSMIDAFRRSTGEEVNDGSNENEKRRTCSRFLQYTKNRKKEKKCEDRTTNSLHSLARVFYRIGFLGDSSHSTQKRWRKPSETFFDLCYPRRRN